MRKELGRILDIHVGLGGYQEMQFGYWLTLGSDSWGVGAGDGCWDPTQMECGDYCMWTEEDRTEQLDKVFRKLSELLKQAKVRYTKDLKGVPVEVTLDGTTLKSWRILEEVI